MSASQKANDSALPRDGAFEKSEKSEKSEKFEKKENAKKRIAVIGGGPAGMTAAYFAAKKGAEVELYEKNPMLGKKLRITGKGRCNVTNDCAPDEFLKNVTRNHRFLYSAIYRFTPRDAMDFFEGLGVPLKTERGRRVFPVSDCARDVAEAMERALYGAGVRVVYNKKVDKIEIKDGRVVGVSLGGATRRCDAAIVATGGLSYPKTGSDGDGYRFAEAAGIAVTELKASLVPIVTKENFSALSGLSLKNVVLKVTKKDTESGDEKDKTDKKEKKEKKGKSKNTEKIVFSELGEMLFTHFGVSGPLVLSASSHMTDGDIGDYEMSLDLKPALSPEELDARLLSDFKKYSKKDFINSLDDLLPQKLIETVVSLSGIPPRIKVNSVTKEMRASLNSVLKNFPITPLRTRKIDEAIVTCGGVAASELYPKTMECRKVEGLYFAGEVIDADAYTGGYNLQIAYSTGVLAGEAAAERCLEEK